MFLHFNFFHQRMLFGRYTPTANCYLSLSITMLLRVEFFPFFPFFRKVIVFITIFWFLMRDKVFRTNKDTGAEAAFILWFYFEWLTNDSCDGSVILGDTNQNSYLLFFVTYKASCTVKRINPETNILFFKPMQVFLNREFLNKLVWIHFREIHNFSFLSYFFAHVIISVSILLTNYL